MFHNVSANPETIYPRVRERLAGTAMANEYTLMSICLTDAFEWRFIPYANSNSSNLFVTIPAPKSKFAPPIEKVDFSEVDKAAIKRARKSSFAAASNLSHQLKKAKVDNKDLWGHLKYVHKVESRKDLNEKQWVIIEARLHAANKNPKLCYLLINEVKVWKKEHPEFSSPETPLF